MPLPPVAHADWYEIIRMADDVTLIHEPWIKPFFRCNIWHVRGRDRDLLFDSGLGHVSLRAHVGLVAERPLTCVASHTISITSAAITNSASAASTKPRPPSSPIRATNGRWPTAMRPTRCSIACLRVGRPPNTASRPRRPSAFWFMAT